MFFICQYPPLAIKALWFNTLMADTAYNITHQPTIRHSLPHRASLQKTITQTCLTIYAACSTGKTHYKNIPVSRSFFVSRSKFVEDCDAVA